MSQRFQRKYYQLQLSYISWLSNNVVTKLSFRQHLNFRLTTKYWGWGWIYLCVQLIQACIHENFFFLWRFPVCQTPIHLYKTDIWGNFYHLLHLNTTVVARNIVSYYWLLKNYRVVRLISYEGVKLINKKKIRCYHVCKTWSDRDALLCDSL